MFPRRPVGTLFLRASALTIPVCLVCWISWSLIRQSVDDQTASVAAERLRTVAALLNAPPADSSASGIPYEELRASFPGVPGEEYLEIRSADGRIVFSSGGTHISDPVSGRNFPVDLSIGALPYRLFKNEIDDRTIVLALPTGQTDTLLRRIGELHIAAVLVVLFVSVTVSLFTIRRERRKAEAIAGYRSRMDNSFERLRRFTGDASHELKTPVTLLRARLEEGLREETGGEELKVIIADCLDAALRMNALIDNLLLLSRADSGRERIAMKPVDLGALAAEIAADMAQVASVLSVSLRLVRADAVVVNGDRELLRRMILNLADNAIRYNRPGGTVGLAVEKRDEEVVLTVRDSGIGIAAEDLPKIFDRFYRSARTEVPGTGLGLPIAQAIAAAHGGTISVVSEVNRMTEFTVRLPSASA